MMLKKRRRLLRAATLCYRRGHGVYRSTAFAPRVVTYDRMSIVKTLVGLLLSFPLPGQLFSSESRFLQQHHRRVSTRAFSSSSSSPSSSSSSTSSPETPPPLDLEKVNFEAYLAEVSYSVVASYAPGTSVDGAVPEGLAGLGKTPQLTDEGRSTCRLFRGVQTDVSIRSRGGDPRCRSRSTRARAARQQQQKVEEARRAGRVGDRGAELEAHAMLTAEWNKPGAGARVPRAALAAFTRRCSAATRSHRCRPSHSCWAR